MRCHCDPGEPVTYCPLPVAECPYIFGVQSRYRSAKNEEHCEKDAKDDDRNLSFSEQETPPLIAILLGVYEGRRSFRIGVIDLKRSAPPVTASATVPAVTLGVSR